jgi:hypothetical protein
MVVDIELMRQANNRYSARALQFPDLLVEAVSCDEAIAKIPEALLARHRAGAEVVQIALDDGTPPSQGTWPRHAGTFADDTVYHEMLAEIEKQRRLLDSAHETEAV